MILHAYWKKKHICKLEIWFLFTLGDPPPGLAKDHTFSGFFSGNLPLTNYCWLYEIQIFPLVLFIILMIRWGISNCAYTWRATTVAWRRWWKGREGGDKAARGEDQEEVDFGRRPKGRGPNRLRLSEFVQISEFFSALDDRYLYSTVFDLQTWPTGLDNPGFKWLPNIYCKSGVLPVI